MPVPHRILILGNSGSGKTWLAQTLAHRLQSTAIELDTLHWLPGGFQQRRPPEAAKSAVRDRALAEKWVIEGVFGWLAAEAMPRTQQLIWLVVPEEECVRNLESRPIKSGEDDASRSALFQWCREYRTRQNANAFAGHQGLYDQFMGEKHILASRQEIARFLSDFP